LEQLVNLTEKKLTCNNIERQYGIEPAAATVVVSGAGDGAAEEVQFTVVLKEGVLN
jgi:large subunit ribosomal protein L7/L12